mgnify:CR=1 FL=1
MKKSGAEKIYYASTPDVNVLFVWAFTKFLFPFALLVIFASINAYQVFQNRSSSLVLLWTVLGIVFLFFIYQVVLWKSYHYKITNNGIYFEGGVLVKRKKFVPFSKITNVELSQNIIEKIFNMNKINFQTAGTGGVPKPEITFEGLENVDKPKEVVYHFINI